METVHVNNGKIIFLDSKTCQNINKLNVDNIPLINQLATYHLVMARKNGKKI